MRPSRSRRPTRCSSRSARRRGAAMDTRTSPTSTPPRRRSRRALEGFTVVVTKSTVPVGTGDEVEAHHPRAPTRKREFAVVSNPEFLREGAAIGDFKRPDRVVGTEDDQAVAILKDLYRPLYLNETPIVLTDVRTAELIKYAANAFLATKIYVHQRDRGSVRARRRRRAGKSRAASASTAASAESSCMPARASAARASRRTRGGRPSRAGARREARGGRDGDPRERNASGSA